MVLKTHLGNSKVKETIRASIMPIDPFGAKKCHIVAEFIKYTMLILF